MNPQACLEVRGLRAGYGPTLVLHQVAFSLLPGEWFVLVGANGCGKSTLLDCVAGRKRPAAGEILIGGHALRSASREAKQLLGYGCAQELLPGLLTARQCLEIHAGAKSRAAVDADVLELADEFRFTPYLDCFVDTMSLGTRQKLSVLLALLGEPRLIVLDEAFNGLDPRSAQVLKRHLRLRLQTQGAALLLATHSLDIVEHHADRAGLLADGRLQREWSAEDLARLRGSGERFDDALAATLTG